MDQVSSMPFVLSLSGQGVTLAPGGAGSLGVSAGFSEILSGLVGMPTGVPGNPWTVLTSEFLETLKQIQPEAVKVSVFPRVQGSNNQVARTAQEKSTNPSAPAETPAPILLMFAASVHNPALVPAESSGGASQPSVQPGKNGLTASAFARSSKSSLPQVESLVKQVESLIDRGESIVQQVESLIGETDKILTPSRFSAPEESGIRFPLTPEMINTMEGGTEDTGAITGVLLPDGSASFQVPVRAMVATDSNSSLEVRLGSVREENRDAAGTVSPTSDIVAEAPGLPANVQAVFLLIQASPDVLSPVLNQMSLGTEAVQTADDSTPTVSGVGVNVPDPATSIPNTLWVLGKPAHDSRNVVDLAAELIQADPNVAKKMSSTLLDVLRTEKTASNGVLLGPGTVPVATDTLQNPMNPAASKPIAIQSGVKVVPIATDTLQNPMNSAASKPIAIQSGVKVAQVVTDTLHGSSSLAVSKPDMGQPVINSVETADNTDQEILKTVQFTSQTAQTERVVIPAVDDTRGESGPLSVQARPGVLRRMTNAVRTVLNRVSANPGLVPVEQENDSATGKAISSVFRTTDSKPVSVSISPDATRPIMDIRGAEPTPANRVSAAVREPLPVIASLLSSAEGKIEIEIRTVGGNAVELPSNTLVAWQAHLEAGSDRQLWVTWKPIEGIGPEPALGIPTPLEFSRTAEMLASRDYGSQIRGLVISSSQPTNAVEVQGTTETAAQPLGSENVFLEKPAVLIENPSTIPARSDLPETGITAPIKPPETTNPFVKTAVFESRGADLADPAGKPAETAAKTLRVSDYSAKSGSRPALQSPESSPSGHTDGGKGIDVKQSPPASPLIEATMNPPKASNDGLRSVPQQPVEVTPPAYASLGKAGGSDSTVPAHREIEEGRSIERVVRNFRVLSEKGGGTVQIRLSPPSLGEVRIRMEVMAQSVRASIETTSNAAKQLIERNLDGFSKSLAERGLELSSLTVKSSSEGGRSDGFRYSGQQSQNPNLSDSSGQAGQGRQQTAPGHENPKTPGRNGFVPVEDEPEPAAQGRPGRLSRYEFVA